MTQASSKDRLIIALDFPQAGTAIELVEQLGEEVTHYKVGFEMILSGGLPLVGHLIDQGKSVFLDMKLLDIPNTVEKAASAAAHMGVRFLTIHGYPFALEAARRGIDRVPGAKTEILSVTVMTSVSEDDLSAAGYQKDTASLIAERAEKAKIHGADGLILSALDIAPLRAKLGNDLTFVTPGIRPKGVAAGDQTRVIDPASAIALGSDYLVVGRPVTQSDDPLGVARGIKAEIAEGFARRDVG